MENEPAHQASPSRGQAHGTADAIAPPQVSLLSNGSYGVMITQAGSGASTWRGLDVTRWREDATRDCWGQFVYVRCLGDDRIWSIGHQPIPREADEYQVAFSADRAEFRRRDGEIETSWAVCVARDHDAEARLVTLVNHGGKACELDLTGYAEVCLNNRRADQGHPAFAKLFQLDCRPAAVALPAPLEITRPTDPAPPGNPAMPPEALQFWNGFGGFASGGRDYVILIDRTASGEPSLPPASWTNVLANPGFYAEWVLGTLRDSAPLQVVCDRDVESGAVLAHNFWAGDFAGALAFAAVGSRPHSFTADRTEFLGRGGSPAAPTALGRIGLSGRVGPALDPCAALLTPIVLAPGQAEEIVFVLGQTDTLEKVRHLTAYYTVPGRAQETLQEVQRLWDRIPGAVQVTTPDAGLDLMVNRWLPYQVLACRVWGRSAFYQSSGAYGFRDQLQDAMALAYSAPRVARDQILRSAGRQFEEGDVQHWWHPPSGRGVRTRITDDLYFLPLVVHHHVTVTGDTALLDERVPFLTSPVLRPDQLEDYNLPGVSEHVGTVYEHCIRALEYGYKLGVHGLPLMGTGDWNDGMNKVGARGKAESVWNGRFFITVLNAFAELAGQRGDAARLTWCRERAEALRAALEAHAWDGAWYRRAYFDDGTPLGSAQNDECQIDALPQAWALISGAADPARAEQALASVEARLVHPESKLIQLFDPPFDRGPLQPGYIKGYVPGIRENGGQYTHGAVWVVLATALQGRGDRALELWNLINPVYHATTLAEVQHYKVEPYVVCADIYGAPPHTGRGGWTWYTGSAGWLYRVALEAILGFRRSGDTLRFEPCIPCRWAGFQVAYRHGSATYKIQVENLAGTGRGVRSVLVDGQAVPDGVVPLRDDGREHDVRVALASETG